MPFLFRDISVFVKKYLTGSNVDSIIKKRLLRVQRIPEAEEGYAMKSTGIIRKVDDLGRIVLPIELRRTLDIEERDELEIYMENDRIILQKFEPACVFCGSSRSLVSYRRKNVCQECIKKMSEY